MGGGSGNCRIQTAGLQLMLLNDGVERKPCIHQKNEGAGPHLAYCRAQVPGSPAAAPPTPAVLP